MNSKIFPSSHPQDAKCGQLGRSILQPRQTLNISAALAQGSAARAAFAKTGRSDHRIGLPKAVVRTPEFPLVADPESIPEHAS